MTEAQEKILLETHGLAKETRGAMKGLVSEVKQNRAGIADNGGKIRDVEGVMVTKAECLGVQDKGEARRVASISTSVKLFIAAVSFVNLIVGSGLVAKLAGWI